MLNRRIVLVPRFPLSRTFASFQKTSRKTKVALEWKVPMQVGRYQLFETLGVGATSRVVRGFDPMIGRPVAVKLFPADLARGEARDRLLREARVVGQLS